MKKHILGVLIVTAVLALSAVGIWYAVNLKNAKSLYKISGEFLSSEDTQALVANISMAESLYKSETLAVSSNFELLQEIIVKLDTFEADLNSYMVLSNIKPSETNRLVKTYKNLDGSREMLIKDYNEYITRMSGNTNMSGNAIQDLYNDIVDNTESYIYKYNTCFASTYKHVFGKVYKADSIKYELYSLYSAGIKGLLSDALDGQANSLTSIKRLNKGVKLTGSNIYINSEIIGGEFGEEALKFKHYFHESNIADVIDNFEIYYNVPINPNSETSNEKLAVYYAKQILNMGV